MPQLFEFIQTKERRLIGFQCDICKDEFLSSDIKASEPVVINHTFGYGTNMDSRQVHAAICETCTIDLCEKHSIPIADSLDLSSSILPLSTDNNWESFFHVDQSEKKSAKELQEFIYAGRIIDNLFNQPIYVIELVIYVIDFFGDRSKAYKWLNTANDNIGGKIPILHALEHPDEVVDIVRKINFYLP